MTEDEAKTTRCCGPEGCGERQPDPPRAGSPYDMGYPLPRIGGGYDADASAAIGMMDNASAIRERMKPRLCIGSACMAWRWVMEPSKYTTGVLITAADRAAASAQGKSQPDWIAPSTFPTEWAASERGFCGLAGKP